MSVLAVVDSIFSCSVGMIGSWLLCCKDLAKEARTGRTYTSLLPFDYKQIYTHSIL
jgi:hypothetical protein